MYDLLVVYKKELVSPTYLPMTMASVLKIRARDQVVKILGVISLKFPENIVNDKYTHAYDFHCASALVSPQAPSTRLASNVPRPLQLVKSRKRPCTGTYTTYTRDISVVINTKMFSTVTLYGSPVCVMYRNVVYP